MSELSGPVWVPRFPESTDVNDLVDPFKTGVTNFLAALSAAGATVTISATYRPPERAFLMHWSWPIAQDGQVPPTGYQPMASVDINWDHGDAASSQAAAQQMVDGYGMVYQAALVSRHTQRLAIDMTISWSGDLTINDASGNATTITSTPRSGLNTDLQTVGASYGVIHATFAGDPPHWSNDGH